MIHEEIEVCVFVAMWAGVEYCSLFVLIQFLYSYVVCVVLNWNYDISSGL